MANPLQLLDALKNSFPLKRFLFPDGEIGTAPVLHGADGLPLFTATSPGAVKALGGFAPVQTFPATVAFNGADTSGSGGSNGTVVQVIAANPSRTYLEIINNGPADVELWLASKPASGDVGAAVKKGIVLGANGGGRSYEARVPLSAMYATTTVAGVLSVIEG